MTEKKYFRATPVIAAFIMLLACSCKPGDDNGKAPSERQTAMEAYWSGDWQGPMGIQVQNDPYSGAPMMYLGGKPLYTTGVNCYNLFVQCHEADKMNTDLMRKTVDELVREQVPIVRFSGSPFYAKQFTYYLDQKEKYLGNLDKLASWCDEAHIALIPSVFWNISSVTDYYGEEAKAWGNTESKTYAHMLAYTEDVVNVLKKHKSVVMWEFGNEFNLAADISNAGYPDIPARAVETAYKGFAEKVASLDPEGRCIATGNSIMRNAQYHLMTQNNWNTDSFEEYKKITEVMTPRPMTGMSEHIYEDARTFSDLGKVKRSEQVRLAKKAAAELGKVYYVGEFTGPATAKGDSLTVRRHYISYFAQRVQVSLIWNYALRGDIEWSFKADSPYGRMAFNLMREYNGHFDTLAQ